MHNNWFTLTNLKHLLCHLCIYCVFMSFYWTQSTYGLICIFPNFSSRTVHSFSESNKMIQNTTYIHICKKLTSHTTVPLNHKTNLYFNYRSDRNVIPLIRSKQMYKQMTSLPLYKFKLDVALALMYREVVDDPMEIQAVTGWTTSEGLGPLRATPARCLGASSALSCGAGAI